MQAKRSKKIKSTMKLLSNISIFLNTAQFILYLFGIYYCIAYIEKIMNFYNNDIQFQIKTQYKPMLTLIYTQAVLFAIVLCLVLMSIYVTCAKKQNYFKCQLYCHCILYFSILAVCLTYLFSDDNYHDYMEETVYGQIKVLKKDFPMICTSDKYYKQQQLNPYQTCDLYNYYMANYRLSWAVICGGPVFLFEIQFIIWSLFGERKSKQQNDQKQKEMQALQEQNLKFQQKQLNMQQSVNDEEVDNEDDDDYDEEEEDEEEEEEEEKDGVENQEYDQEEQRQQIQMVNLQNKQDVKLQQEILQQYENDEEFSSGDENQQQLENQEEQKEYDNQQFDYNNIDI